MKGNFFIGKVNNVLVIWKNKEKMLLISNIRSCFRMFSLKMNRNLLKGELRRRHLSHSKCLQFSYNRKYLESMLRKNEDGSI